MVSKTNCIKNNNNNNSIKRRMIMRGARSRHCIAVCRLGVKEIYGRTADKFNEEINIKTSELRPMRPTTMTLTHSCALALRLHLHTDHSVSGAALFLLFYDHYVDCRVLLLLLWLRFWRRPNTPSMATESEPRVGARKKSR